MLRIRRRDAKRMARDELVFLEGELGRGKDDAGARHSARLGILRVT